MNNNQKKSRESISSKIKRISNYIENGIPVQCDKNGNQLYKDKKPLLVYTPLSLDQFLRWSDEDNFKQTGKAALDKYLSFNDKEIGFIENLLSELRSRRKRQLSSDDKLEFSERNKHLEEIILAQNKSIAKYLLEIEMLKENVKKSEEVNQNLLKHIELKNQAYNIQVSELKNKIDRLSNIRVIK
ncbi:TPA: hypothetical protein ACX6PT_000819 [Photobacterium damselae]